MNPREVNVLLTKINARDKFPRWTTPEAMAFTAKEWADDLGAVALEDAVDAMRAHYAVTDERMTIADILAASPERLSSWAGNVTEQRLAAEASGQVEALEPGHDGR